MARTEICFTLALALFVYAHGCQLNVTGRYGTVMQKATTKKVCSLVFIPPTSDGGNYALSITINHWKAGFTFFGTGPKVAIVRTPTGQTWTQTSDSNTSYCGIYQRPGTSCNADITNCNRTTSSTWPPKVLTEMCYFNVRLLYAWVQCPQECTNTTTSPASPTLKLNHTHERLQTNNTITTEQATTGTMMKHQPTTRSIITNKPVDRVPNSNTTDQSVHFVAVTEGPTDETTQRLEDDNKYSNGTDFVPTSTTTASKSSFDLFWSKLDDVIEKHKKVFFFCTLLLAVLLIVCVVLLITTQRKLSKLRKNNSTTSLFT